MESPLWIDTYAPSIDELPQEDVQGPLRRGADGALNMLLHGPPGSGKTAAARAIAQSVHTDPDNDFVEINVADFFTRTKKEIREDPRFAPLLSGEIPWVKQLATSQKDDLSKRYKRQWSKADMINYVLKESAAIAPSSGEYKTILLDNAESIRSDFQQALRRVMERHYETTQFIITTRQPSKLIPAIVSRCFRIPVRAPTDDEIVNVLNRIVTQESVTADQAGLQFIATNATGNLRTAILDAQTVADTEGEITRETAYSVLREVGQNDRFTQLLHAATAGDFADAREILDTILINDGYTGPEVLDGILAAARSHDDIAYAQLVRQAGDIDMDLATGSNDRLHIAHLLAQIGAE